MEEITSPGQSLRNYKMVDIIKFVAAILVICIHCSRIFPLDELDYFLKQIVCRVAVPFFFISSAYFVRKGCDSRPGYLKKYLVSLSKSYLAWSVIFVPIGLDWLQQNLTLSRELLPLALLFGLIHVGTYYHLWYIPAMIFSIFVLDKLLKRFSYKILFPVAGALFLFGSLETYYGLIPNGGFKQFFDTIIQVLFTTRSGLFFGLIFVLIGFFIYDYRETLKSMQKYLPAMTVLSALLLFAEGFLLYSVPRLDMNFLIMLIPFSFFFFLWVLSFPHTPSFDTAKIRELSKYYYFVHPICIVIVEELLKAFHVSFPGSGVISFLLILLLTHLLCLTIIAIKRQSLRLPFIPFAVLGGIIDTFLSAGLVYQLKAPDTQMKFELVPCLLVFFSFITYFLLIRHKGKAAGAA